MCEFGVTGVKQDLCARTSARSNTALLTDRFIVAMVLHLLVHKV
jgi:hypothetical protein